MGNALAQLGITLPSLVAQIVNFGILFVLLYVVAYKPVLKMLDERSQKIRDSIEQTERIKEQAARAEEETKRRIEAGIKEGQELVAKAAKAAEEIRLEAQRRAQEDAQVILNRARNEIQRERDEAIGALRSEFAELTVIAAEKVIERSLDRQAHRDIIDKVLEEAGALKQE